MKRANFLKLTLLAPLAALFGWKREPSPVEFLRDYYDSQGVPHDGLFGFKPEATYRGVDGMLTPYRLVVFPEDFPTARKILRAP